MGTERKPNLGYHKLKTRRQRPESWLPQADGARKPMRRTHIQFFNRKPIEKGHFSHQFETKVSDKQLQLKV